MGAYFDMQRHYVLRDSVNSRVACIDPGGRTWVAVCRPLDDEFKRVESIASVAPVPPAQAEHGRAKEHSGRYSDDD